MSAVEDHNRLAREFVMKVAGATTTDSEMMVVLESAILAAMLILAKRSKHPARYAVEMVEIAVQQATERFAALQPGEPA